MFLGNSLVETKEKGKILDQDSRSPSIFELSTSQIHV
jgi:hypothetical protein